MIFLVRKAAAPGETEPPLTVGGAFLVEVAVGAGETPGGRGGTVRSNGSTFLIEVVVAAEEAVVAEVAGAFLVAVVAVGGGAFFRLPVVATVDVAVEGAFFLVGTVEGPVDLLRRVEGPVLADFNVAVVVVDFVRVGFSMTAESLHSSGGVNLRRRLRPPIGLLKAAAGETVTRLDLLPLFFVANVARGTSSSEEDSKSLKMCAEEEVLPDEEPLRGGAEFSLSDVSLRAAAALIKELQTPNHVVR